MTGTVAIANGGTGQTTAQLAINALSAVAAATNEHILTKDTATGNAIFKVAPAGGGGAPATATYITQTADGTLSAEQALSALATGIVKVTTTTGVLTTAVAGDFPTLNQNTTGTAANVTGTVAIANGGTGQVTAVAAFDALSPLTTQGDILYNDGTNDVRLPKGNAYLQLRMNSTATAPEWAERSQPSVVHVLPVGLFVSTLTAVTVLTTGVSHFIYMGRAANALTSVSIVQNVTTAAVTITWAEVAIFTGNLPTIGGAASLTRVGFTSVATTYNSTGRKTTAVTVSGVIPGDHLWVAYGAAATTMFQVRGMVADDLQGGTFQTDTIRPSLAASPEATAIASATLVPAWTAARI